MHFRKGQVAVVNEVRAKLGLGLREAYDLTERHPNLSAEEIVAKLQPQQAAAPADRYSSKLAVRGWIVVSQLFPEFSGYQPQMTDDIREKLQRDKDAVIHELVYKAEADELIGKMQRLSAH